ncbi:AAA family ATPase [Pseudoxanthomonas kaohsiungensis]|uniref:AAA family ATPase n=1 Tax=Pseudoxanthomonas kaohsiungensis TaxID=283923 RepID=A0ABW3M246_9GAMM|nr:AAA family ATPase [Pseudoxanthomonas kaohsiungensis]KAF1702962.1 chromosome partitioning protein [Pseudoxanthomonas kaohsiungensis]
MEQDQQQQDQVQGRDEQHAKAAPKIVLVGGEKGGTGKTTIAANIAVCLAKQGKDVLLVDTDPQGTATMWAYYRDEAQIEPRVTSIQKQGKSVAKDLTDLATRYEYLVVDAGGRDSVELRSAMVVANVMIVPIQASSFDVWTLRQIDNLVEQVQAVRATFHAPLDVRILINRGSTNVHSKDSEMASEVVKDFQNFTLMQTELHDRRSYRTTATAGKSVIEGDDGKAMDEFNKLFSEIYDNG